MNRETAARPITILLVEDNPGDAELTDEALRRGRVANDMRLTEDGEAALAYLRREDGYQGAPRPDLILLDLNLPRKSGREVLAEIKRDGQLKAIPVIVLTTSGAEEDILRAYNLAVNCYITKPVDFDQFVKVVNAIEEFWFTIVKLPPPEPANYCMARSPGTGASGG